MQEATKGADKTLGAIGIDNPHSKDISDGLMKGRSAVHNVGAANSGVKTGIEQTTRVNEALDSMKEEGLNQHNADKALQSSKNVAKSVKQTVYGAGKAAEDVLGKNNGITENSEEIRKVANKVDKAIGGSQRMTKGKFQILGGRRR
jgi:hypothetical protein